LKTIIGLLASGSGASLEASIAVLKLRYPQISFIGFSDRECGAYEVLSRNCKTTSICISSDNRLISISAANFFAKNGCNFVILSYGRLVTRDLYDKIPCYNIHPSLLPDYKGFGAIKAAFNDKVRCIGVTIHEVNETMDGGKIVCQAAVNPSLFNIEYWFSLSYLMKIVLMIAFVESQVQLDGDTRLTTVTISPYLTEQITLINMGISPISKHSFMKIVPNSTAFSISSALK